jgi:hypothetical protein
MPKSRKTKTKSVTTRRRGTSRKFGKSVGAVNTSEILGMIIGAAGSRILVNQVVGKFMPSLVGTPMNKALTQVGVGVAVMPVGRMLGIKSPMLGYIGKGGMLMGGIKALEAAVPSIMGAADDGDVIVINGADISEINGMDDIGSMDISEINGMNDIGQFDETY